MREITILMKLKSSDERAIASVVVASYSPLQLNLEDEVTRKIELLSCSRRKTLLNRSTIILT